MLQSLRSRRAWRLAAVLIVMLAMVLSMMPTVASAHDGNCAAWYKVQPGDTVIEIARWYAVPVHALIKANHLNNPSFIFVGQKLCIPAGGHSGGHDGGNAGGHNGGHYGGGCWYTVQSGDNLSEIGAWYGVPWPHLARVNHLSNPRVVIPGQRLYVCW